MAMKLPIHDFRIVYPPGIRIFRKLSLVGFLGSAGGGGRLSRIRSSSISLIFASAWLSSALPRILRQKYSHAPITASRAGVFVAATAALAAIPLKACVALVWSRGQ